MSSFLTGFLMSSSLAVAIGPQNAFLLRQGLIRQHLFIIAAFCTLSDALLMVLGIFGFGGVIERFPIGMFVVRVLGVGFLLWYGALCAIRAYRGGNSLQVDSISPSPLAPAVATVAALTFLNPHVYLDTVLLLGTVGQQQPESLRGWFLLGSVAGSAVWFFGLVYGARLLVPFFRKPVAWQVLDGMVCVTMVVIAVGLLVG